jgi:hypothetical protein
MNVATRNRVAAATVTAARSGASFPSVANAVDVLNFTYTRTSCSAEFKKS